VSVFLESNEQLNLSQQLSDNLPTCEKIETFRVRSLWAKVKVWKAVSKQRNHLARLDDRLLNDIGLTREQVKVELAKPFWK